jgi:hypothetical protein
VCKGEVRAGVQRGVLARKEGCMGGGVRAGEASMCWRYKHKLRRLDVRASLVCGKAESRRSAGTNGPVGMLLLMHWRGRGANTLLAKRCTSRARGVCASEVEYEPEPEPSTSRSVVYAGCRLGVRGRARVHLPRVGGGVVGSLDVCARWPLF